MFVWKCLFKTHFKNPLKAKKKKIQENYYGQQDLFCHCPLFFSDLSLGVNFQPHKCLVFVPLCRSGTEPCEQALEISDCVQLRLLPRR